MGEQELNERGAKSKNLQEAIERGKKAGGVAVEGPDDGGYDRVTDPKPEAGIFTLVGGYVDAEGELHKEVSLRSMSGHEEDLLGNRSVPMVQRMDQIMGNCVKSLGSITDKGEILRAVRSMSSGSRTHLLIALRVTSHWKTHGSKYEMEMRCPASNTCGKIGYYKVDLLDLELFEPEDPSVMIHSTELPDSGHEVSWAVMTGREDRIMHGISSAGVGAESSALSYSILTRLRGWDGESIDLEYKDFLTSGKKAKIKLSSDANRWLNEVKGLTTADRDHLRGEFEKHEPGIEMDVDIDCSHCGREFIAKLDISQEQFFFPTATSRRSKRISSS